MKDALPLIPALLRYIETVAAFIYGRGCLFDQSFFHQTIKKTADDGSAHAHLPAECKGSGCSVSRLYPEQCINFLSRTERPFRYSESISELLYFSYSTPQAKIIVHKVNYMEIQQNSPCLSSSELLMIGKD